MTHDEMIQAAIAEHTSMAGYSYDNAKLAAAVAEGLVQGDRIALGGALVAAIMADGEIAMINDGKETCRVSLAALTDAQRDRMTVLKAVQASRKGYQIG